MKRLYLWLFAVILFLWATPVYAFGFGDVKAWLASGSWTAIAMLATAVIALFGLATRAQWLSAVLLAVAALINAVGVSIASVGNALQDGKIDAAEIKMSREAFGGIAAPFRAVIGIFKGAKING